MNKRIITLSIAIICFALFVSCNREDDPSNPDNGGGGGGTPSVTHVYMAGTSSSDFFSGPAVCWEDGVQHTLDANAYDAARAACVFGSDVYYGGCDANSHPVLWKNGVPQVLSNEYGCVTDLTVANGKLYASGYVNSHPVYWEDGQIVSLPEDPNSYYSGYVTTAIYVSGNDIYVTGYLGSELNTGKGAYLWKNGVCQKLSDKESEARDVCVYNNTVYVVGSEKYTDGGIQKSVMWVNGAVQDVQVTTNNGLGSKATAVAIKDGKPYVLAEGWIGSAYDGDYKGFVWHGGTVTNISNYGCDRPRALFIHNNDIYIAGTYGEYTNRPVLLKNLSKVTLNNGYTGEGWCLDIFVK